jgi:hypothetical protein
MTVENDRLSAILFILIWESREWSLQLTASGLWSGRSSDSPASGESKMGKRAGGGRSGERAKILASGWWNLVRFDPYSVGACPSAGT